MCQVSTELSLCYDILISFFLVSPPTPDGSLPVGNPPRLPSTHSHRIPPRTSSRPPSVTSHAPSTYSSAGSTRHILSNSNVPSAARYAGRSSNNSNASSGLSLAVNYIPSKFSKTLLNPLGSSTRKRRVAKDTLDPAVPKQGGGIDAFKSGEARIGGLQDEDDIFLLDGQSKPARRLRWNRFKWALFVGNLLVSTFLTSSHFAYLT